MKNYETNDLTAFISTAVSIGLAVSVESWDNAEIPGVIDVGHRVSAHKEDGLVVGEFLVNCPDGAGKRVHLGVIDLSLSIPKGDLKKYHYSLSKVDIPIVPT